MEVPPLEIKQYNLTMDGETVAVVYARNDITIWREDEREFTVRGSPEVEALCEVINIPAENTQETE